MGTTLFTYNPSEFNAKYVKVSKKCITWLWSIEQLPYNKICNFNLRQEQLKNQSSTRLP